MAEVTTGNEVPQNMTIYINNLNEKIKLEGTCAHTPTHPLSLELSVSHAQAKRIVFLIDCWSRRVEEVAARGVLAVREDTGGAGVQDAEAQGAGVGGLRGRVLRHQCASPNAGLSFLRQAHGNTAFPFLNPPPPFFCSLRFQGFVLHLCLNSVFCLMGISSFVYGNSLNCMKL